MDVTPLNAKVEENARRIAEGFLSEARARVNDLQASTDAQIQEQQAQTVKDAKMQGEKLEDGYR